MDPRVNSTAPGNTDSSMAHTYCTSCGEELPASARFCASCGTPRTPAQGETVIEEPAPAPAPEASEPAAPPAPAPEAPAPTGALWAGAPGEDAAPDEATAPQAAAVRREPVPPRERVPLGKAEQPDDHGRPGPDGGPSSSASSDAAELARRLAAQARRPAVVAALVAGALAALACLAFGAIVAVAFPDDDTIVGALGQDAGFVTETLRHTVSLLQVSFNALPLPGGPSREVVEFDSSGNIAPLAFLAIPLGACALASALLLRRSHGTALRARLIPATAITVPFTVIMLIVAIASGDADPSIPGTLFLGLLWSAVGAGLGAALVLRRERASALPPAARTPGVRNAASAVAASLRALGLLLAVTAILGTGAWAAFGLIDDENDEDRARATVELALYGADHAVHLAELGTFAAFEAPSDDGEAGFPVPADDADELSEKLEDDDSYRIFALDDGMDAYLFIPGMLLLIGVCLLVVLLGGFITARTAGASGSPALFAAWGALVGPVWTVALALLDVFASKTIDVEARGQSASFDLFGSTDGLGGLILVLLVATALGALGGLLAGTTSSGPARAADTSGGSSDG